MANFFSKIARAFGFGGNKEEKPQTYGGARPYSSLTQTEPGSLYYQTLKDRLAGIGVGPKEYLIDINAATNPYASARRSNIANYEAPLISAQASARGLGRSTIPVNRIALSQQEGERDIAQKLSEFDVQNKAIQQQNEFEKRQEISDALTKMGGFATDEMNAYNNRVGFDYGDWSNNAAARKAYLTDYSNRESAGIQNIVQTLAKMAVGGMTPSPTGTVVGGSSSNSDLMADLNKLNKAGQVNISGIDNTSYYKPLKGYYS